MVSLTVADAVNQNEWHLPTYDQRNENQYHYKLQALDMYFWKQQDALQFINGVRRVLPPSSVEVLDEPGPPPHPDSLSNVVRQLEKVAIADPHCGTDARASQSTIQSVAAPVGSGGPTNSTPLPEHAANFAPMAYNPAAPAAPEAMRPREKTPPPDEDPLNPVAVAVAYDYQKQPFTPAMPPPPQFPPGDLQSPGLPPHGVAIPGPPPPVSSPGIAPPQYGAMQQRASTVPANAGMAPSGPTSPYGTAAAYPGLTGIPPAPHPPLPHTQSQPVMAPTTGIPGHGLPPQGASYFNYAYSHQAPMAGGAMDYSIHQRGYYPLAGEGQPQPYEPKREVRGRLEEGAARVEKGVTGVLKRIEKRFG